MRSFIAMTSYWSGTRWTRSNHSRSSDTDWLRPTDSSRSRPPTKTQPPHESSPAMPSSTRPDKNSSESLEAEIKRLAADARAASAVMGELSTERKNAWLARVASRLASSKSRIMEANARDIDAAAEKGVSAPLRGRLAISDGKWDDMIQGRHDVASLPDPIGRISNHSVRPNGLGVAQMAIPLGVIAMIYESRPNVTVDAAALCVKAGNAVILRGGS